MATLGLHTDSLRGEGQRPATVLTSALEGDLHKFAAMWTGEYRANPLDRNLQMPGATLACALEKTSVAHRKQRGSVADTQKIRHEKQAINAGR